jgi:hypothetical protein
MQMCNNFTTEDCALGKVFCIDGFVTYVWHRGFSHDKKWNKRIATRLYFPGNTIVVGQDS